jgi:hypothetical protein
MKPIITMLCAVLIALSGQVSGQNMSTSFVVSPSSGPGPYPVGTQVKIDFKVNNFTKIRISPGTPSSITVPCFALISITHPALPGYTDFTSVISSHVRCHQNHLVPQSPPDVSRWLHYPGFQRDSDEYLVYGTG